MLSFKRLFQSFFDASRGLIYVFKHEQNFRVQIFISAVVLFFAFYFSLRAWEMILVLLLILLVLIMEIINTALEQFNDLLKPRLHHYVYLIKDTMAGAVFITSLFAVIIGLIIFYPHFIKLLK